MHNSDIIAFSKEVAGLAVLIMKGIMKKEGSLIYKEGLTLAQMIALGILEEKDALKMNEIAGELNISLPAATGLIGRLHKIGMVKREYDDSDRRIIRVRLTPKGKKAIEASRELKLRSMQRAFSGLTEKERQDYLNVLKKIKNIVYEG